MLILLLVMNSYFAAEDKALSWNPADEFWNNTPATVVSTDNFGGLQAANSTDIRSRWTKTNLYFQFTCHYTELFLHPNPTRALETNKLWDWDVAEVFLGSDMVNIRRYREFEMSPQAEWLDIDIDLAHANPAQGWTWNSGMEVTASVDKDHHVWYGAMRIPYKAIDSHSAAEGNSLRFNFYREQGPPTRRIEIAWQPTLQRSYHVPERFGMLRLTK